MPTPLLLILTAAGFGASPLLISIAVQYFPPWTLGALRAALGLPLLLFAAGAFGRHPYPDRQDIVTALVGGVLVIAVPFVSMAAGMQFIPSGLGGILYATMPLFTVLLAAVFLRDEPITALQLSRITIGLTGVALIALPQFRQEGFGGAGLGTLLTLISPLSYAAGNVWFRRRRAVSPLLLSAGMFAVGMAAVWPLALVIEGRVPVTPSQQVIGILLALVVLATVAPALLNYMLVRQAGANRAALAMFLMPGFAVVFGMVFLDEFLPGMAFGGLALVIVSSLPLPSRAGRPVVSAPPEAASPRMAKPKSPAVETPRAVKPSAGNRQRTATAGPATAKANDETDTAPEPKAPPAEPPLATPRQAEAQPETAPAPKAVATKAAGSKAAAPKEAAPGAVAPKAAASEKPASSPPAAADAGPALPATPQAGSAPDPTAQTAEQAAARAEKRKRRKAASLAAAETQQNQAASGVLIDAAGDAQQAPDQPVQDTDARARQKARKDKALKSDAGTSNSASAKPGAASEKPPHRPATPPAQSDPTGPNEPAPAEPGSVTQETADKGGTLDPRNRAGQSLTGGQTAQAVTPDDSTHQPAPPQGTDAAPTGPDDAQKRKARQNRKTSDDSTT